MYFKVPLPQSLPRAGDMHVQAACKSEPAISPATDKSSSNSGQCNEVPPPPISYFVRCSGVALRNNGNQMIGTLMQRPSVRETCIISSSKLTDLARAVVGT